MKVTEKRFIKKTTQGNVKILGIEEFNVGLNPNFSVYISKFCVNINATHIDSSQWTTFIRKRAFIFLP